MQVDAAKRGAMKKLMFGMMFLLASASVGAEWVQIDSSSDGEYALFVGKATIKRNGDLVKMWDLMNFRNEKKIAGVAAMSSKRLSEYDCKKSKMKVLGFSMYSNKMASGRVVFSNYDVEQWDQIVPGAIGDFTWKEACRKK